MPIIKFTAADALQTKVIPAKIYQCQITKIDGPKKSTSGKSYGYYVDIEVTEDGPYQHKTRTLCFNTEMNSPSLLGDMQFFPDSYLLIVNAAIEGKLGVDVVDFQLDTDSLLNAPFDAQWNVQTVEGRLINTVDAFYPAGYGEKVPAF
jgi:hypothetical protein